MSKFEPGDIVEISVSKGHIYDEWNGLTIMVTAYSTGGQRRPDILSGKVLRTATPDQGYPLNSPISWCVPSTFTHVTASLKEAPKEKYQSPFSGRWE